jgi:hypothetical protein
MLILGGLVQVGPSVLAVAGANQNLLVEIAPTLGGGVLGFASAYAIHRLAVRREPHRRLAWDAHLEETVLSVGSDLGEKVKIQYEGMPVERLNVLRLRVENTGNRVVKGSLIRLTFEKARILEAHVRPSQYEVGVQELLTPMVGSAKNERCYKLAHLEKSQFVEFNLILSGPISGWEPYSFNEEGDVEFVRRDVSRAREDQEHVVPFAVTFIVLLALQAVLAGQLPNDLLTSFGQLLRFVLSLILMVTLLPHLVPIARLIRNLIEHILLREEPGSRTIHIFDSHGVVVGDDAKLQLGEPPPDRVNGD